VQSLKPREATWAASKPQYRYSYRPIGSCATRPKGRVVQVGSCLCQLKRATCVRAYIRLPSVSVQYVIQSSRATSDGAPRLSSAFVGVEHEGTVSWLSSYQQLPRVTRGFKDAGRREKKGEGKEGRRRDQGPARRSQSRSRIPVEEVVWFNFSDFRHRPSVAMGCCAIRPGLHVNTTLVAVPIARFNLGHQDDSHVLSSV